MNPIILVTGFGRCGSSLTMQMLQAGGYPVVGEYPAFEHEYAKLSEFNAEWLAAQEGAVKILEPQLLTFKPANYRSIWLDRAAKQQAASQIKYMWTTDGVTPPKNALRNLAASYKRDRPKALEKLEKIGEVMRLTFEDLLRDPFHAARLIAGFVDPLGIQKLDHEAMAMVVIPRPPACRPDLRIEAFLVGKAEMMKGQVNGHDAEPTVE